MHGIYKTVLLLGSAIIGPTVHAQTRLPAESGAVTAQETSPSGVTASDGQAPADGTADIVVTAQRRSQRLLDVPIAASVVSGASLDQGNLKQLQDITARLPNVKIAQGSSQDSITVRGIGSGSNTGFEQAVATFVDGVYRGRSGSSRAALFDVESVEVLRGPQTTFFGNNAIAGALNITTRKPSSTLQVNASGLYGSHGEYDLRAGVGGPLSPTFRVRAAVGASGMNGYIRNDAVNEDGPHLRDVFGRVSAIWEPASNIAITGRLDRARLRDRGNYNVELTHCPPAPEYGAPRGACARALAIGGGTTDDDLDYRTFIGPSFFNYDMTEGAINTRIEFGGNALTFLGGYFEHSFDQLNTVTPGTGASAIGSGFGLTLRTPEKYHQWSGEVRLESTGDGAIGYMVGAYFADSRLDVTADVGYFFAPLGPIIGLPATTRIVGQIDNGQDQQTRSAFGSFTARITDRLRLNIGARYSSVHKSGTRAAAIGTGGITPSVDNFVPLAIAQQQILSGPLGLPLRDYPQRERTDDKFMPSIGLQYTLAHDVMAYTTYSKGFKAGGFGASLSSDVFGPESVDAFEVGLKGSFFDRALTLSVAGFHSEYSDLQENINLINGNSVSIAIRNAAGAVSKGFEGAAVLRVSPTLTVSADAAYLSAKYTDFTNNACTVLQNLTPPCVQDVSGRRRSFSPKLSGNVGLAYAKPFGGDLVFRFEPVVYFTSGYFQATTLDPLSWQKSYAKLDATVSLGTIDRRWDIALIGKNLTDRVTAQFRTPALPTSPGSVAAFADRPRSVAVQVSTRF